MRRFLLLTALLLAGCKAAPPANNTQHEATKLQPAPTIVAQADTRPIIVCFGDSLTEGYGAEAGNSYPDFLERELTQRGYHYRLVNAGVSGNTTKDALDRVEEVVSQKPVLVIVAFGGNDGLRGLPLAETEANLDKIVETLLKSHARVILAGITLPPNYGEQYIRSFNAMYAQLAQKRHLPLMPFLLDKVWNSPGGMQADGIHATAKGNEQVARNLLPILLPLLKKN